MIKNKQTQEHKSSNMDSQCVSVFLRVLINVCSIVDVGGWGGEVTGTLKR